MSVRRDLNPRSHAPKACALARLRYSPKLLKLWSGRPDLNGQPLDPQPSAPPLSYSPKSFSDFPLLRRWWAATTRYPEYQPPETGEIFFSLPPLSSYGTHIKAGIFLADSLA